MKIYYKLSILLLLFFTVACDKQNETVNHYENAAELIAATNEIYAPFYGTDLWGRMLQYFSDLRADEHSDGNGLEFHNAQLLNGTYDNNNYTITAAWRGFYRIIQRANAVIQYAPKTIDTDEALIKQCIAEAKFLRAYAFYYLHVNWGKVPLYTLNPQSAKDAKPPSEENELFQLLEKDLTEIQVDLAWTNTGVDAGRASKGAVKMLLARVYMHAGKYAEALVVLEDIYKNSPYRLMANYADNFMEETEYNEESIFEIDFYGDGFSWSEDGSSLTKRSNVMFQDYNPVGWRNCIPSDKLLNDFEHPYHGDGKEDPRLRETVYFTGDSFGPANNLKVLTDAMQFGKSSVFHGNTIKVSWKKYSPMYKLDPGGYYASNINYRNMRYAEVLIKLAECENEVGTQEKAISYLNEIRARASVQMPGYPTSNYPCNSYDELMRTIMHESMVEFSNEKLRVLELSRWRKNNKFSTLNPEPVLYIANDPSKALLPYPSEESSNNLNF